MFCNAYFSTNTERQAAPDIMSTRQDLINIANPKFDSISNFEWYNVS